MSEGNGGLIGPCDCPLSEPHHTPTPLDYDGNNEVLKEVAKQTKKQLANLEPQPTPTPWMWKQRAEGDYVIEQDNGKIEGELVASEVATEANAALIVQAVNSHEALLTQLKQMHSHYQGSDMQIINGKLAHGYTCRTCEAIAKAEGIS